MSALGSLLDDGSFAVRVDSARALFDRHAKLGRCKTCGGHLPVIQSECRACRGDRREEAEEARR